MITFLNVTIKYDYITRNIPLISEKLIISSNILFLLMEFLELFRVNILSNHLYKTSQTAKHTLLKLIFCFRTLTK